MECLFLLSRSIKIQSKILDIQSLVFLIRFRNPRPMGVVRVNWLCLDKLPGVLEYWSVGVLGLGS